MGEGLRLWSDPTGLFRSRNCTISCPSLRKVARLLYPRVRWPSAAPEEGGLGRGVKGTQESALVSRGRVSETGALLVAAGD